MRWNDARSELEIGQRQGSFDGMLRTRQFVLHKVRPGAGPMSSSPGIVAAYSGEALTIVL